MEQPPENNTGRDAGGVSAEPPVVSSGRMLREARERLGMSVADVAGQIKLAVRQIEALEADDFQRLPEMPFVRGFVRSYARILHLDAQALLAALPQTEAVPVRLEPVSVEAPFPGAHSPQRQNLIWLGAALLLAVAVVAFAVWHFTTPPAEPEAVKTETPVPLPDEAQVIAASPVVESGVIAPPPATAKQSSAETAQPPVAVVKPPVSQDVPQAKAKKLPGASSQTSALRLAFDGESWAEVRDKDGNMLSSQTNSPGSELRLDGNAPFSLVIGQAASVRLYYKGKQVDLTPYTSSLNVVARLTLE